MNSKNCCNAQPPSLPEVYDTARELLSASNAQQMTMKHFTKENIAKRNRENLARVDKHIEEYAKRGETRAPLWFNDLRGMEFSAACRSLRERGFKIDGVYVTWV